jgi:hypothetical protein
VAVHISDSNIEGKGLFASDRIPANSLVFVATGELINRPFGTYWASVNQRALCIGNNNWIRPSKNDFLWYLNHSCNPNVGISGSVHMISLKDIRKDEEITLDYSITEEDPNWRLNCHCKSEHCRGLIKSIQFLDSETIRKYLPYIPSFQKINR